MCQYFGDLLLSKSVISPIVITIVMAEIVILIIITLYAICKATFFPLQTINEIDDPNEDEKLERMAGTIKVSNLI